jgi:PilZ domain/GYF domain 2
MSDQKTQTMYHVSKAGSTTGESFGPWTIEEIAERLAKTEIAITDFVYDEVREDWIALVECEALKEHLRRSKPKAPPKAAASSASAPAPQPVAVVAKPTPEAAEAREMQPMAMATMGPNGEWFVQKGTHRYGPFSYLSLVRALQEKSVYEFDFIWTEGMESWVRLAEHEAFKSERIRDLANDKTAAASIFTQRAHARMPFESEVIVHDDRSAWIGRAYEGSVGGSGLVIENAALYPGQTVRLHFAPADGLPAFNVSAEIVNKKFMKAVKGQKTPVQYAVRFLEMDESTRNRVTEHFSGSKAA